MCKEQFEDLELSDEKNPFKEGKYSKENNQQAINYNINQIKDCIKILNENNNIFKDKEEEMDESAKDILLIRNNYSNGNYSGDTFRFMCDLGRINIRYVLKRELNEIHNHIHYLKYCPDSDQLKYCKQAAQLRKVEIEQMLNGEKPILLPRSYSTEDITIVTEKSNETKYKMKYIKEMHREVSTDLKKTKQMMTKKKKGTKHNPRLSCYLGKENYIKLKARLDEIDSKGITEEEQVELSRKRTKPLQDQSEPEPKRLLESTQKLNMGENEENTQMINDLNKTIEINDKNLFMSDDTEIMNNNVNNNENLNEVDFKQIEENLSENINMLMEASKMIRKSDSLEKFLTFTRDNGNEQETMNETNHDQEQTEIIDELKSPKRKPAKKKKKNEKVTGTRKRICRYCKQQYFPGCCEQTKYCSQIEDGKTTSKKQKRGKK